MYICNYNVYPKIYICWINILFGQKQNRKSIQHAVSVVVSKHNNEIIVIQEEVKILKDNIKIMKEKLDAIDKEAEKVQDTESVEVQEEEIVNSDTSS